MLSFSMLVLFQLISFSDIELVGKVFRKKNIEGPEHVLQMYIRNLFFLLFIGVSLFFLVFFLIYRLFIVFLFSFLVHLKSWSCTYG